MCDRNGVVCSENFCKTDSWGQEGMSEPVCVVCVCVEGWGLVMLSVFARLVSALSGKEVCKWQVWL